MSVLIKGIKMPISCVDCPCVNDEPRYCRPTNCFIPMTGKPKFCPLVEIPVPHGRLIDADALKLDYGMKDDCNDCEREMRGSVKACEYDRVYAKMDFCGCLDDAPTVIEAEEDYED